MALILSSLQQTDAKTFLVVLVISTICGGVFYIGYKYDSLAMRLVEILKGEFPNIWLDLEEKGYDNVLLNGVGGVYGKVFKQFKILKYINQTSQEHERILSLVARMNKLLLISVYGMFGVLILAICILALVIK